MKTEIFSTESLPSPAGAVRGWQNANRRYTELDFDIAPRDNAFSANMRICSSRQLRFSTLSVSSHVGTLSTVRHRDVEPHYQIACVIGGSVTVGQDGRETFVSAGDFVVIDTVRPFRLDTPSMQAHAIDIPTARMREIFPLIDGLTSVSIDGQRGPGAVLRGIFENIFNHARDIGDDEADHIAAAIPHMTASLLASLPARGVPIPGRVDGYHRQRIRNFVRENLRNKELTPDMVARSLDLSVRYVHKLGESGPITLMRWVWAERIARCASELAKPELRHRTVSEIAFYWGFHDAAHFSRLFRAHMGKSPKAYREEHLRP